MTQPTIIAPVQPILDVGQAIARSAETPENLETMGAGGIDRYGLLWYVGQYADAIPPWGTAPTQRDALLRNFFSGGEPIATSAFASITTKYSALKWNLKCADENLLQACKLMLASANWGRGWTDFISKLVWDILTQDKGAFIEIVRAYDSPAAPVIGIKTLDAACCWSTGNPEVPVLYLDRRSGRWHQLKFYQVWSLLEVPVHHTGFHGLQLSAATRVLKAAQVFKSVIQYQDEKIGGRHTKAIHIVSGVAKEAMNAAMVQQQALSDQLLLQRYIQPVILSVLGDKPAGVATLNLSSMPEGWDAEKERVGYLTILAMALNTDYGELAPLPGGGLGTATQSAVMDKKSQEKGTGLFQLLIEEVMNRIILPVGVTFEYDLDTTAAEMSAAAVGKARADTRAIMVANGEIDDAAARQMAIDAGDIPEAIAIEVEQRQSVAAAQSAADSQVQFAQKLELARAQGQMLQPGPGMMPQPFGAKAIDPERLAAEEEAATEISRALAKVRSNVHRKLLDLEN